MSKFLVTGATGYLGRHLVRELIRGGHEILILSRKSRLELFDVFPEQKFESLRFDIDAQNFECFEGMGFTGFTLVDLAWNFESSDHTQQAVEHYNFIMRLVNLGVGKVAVAGTLQELDFDQGEIDELAPRLGTGAHGRAKSNLFLRLNSQLNHQGVPLLWMRFHYIFGDDSNSRSIFGKIAREPKPFYIEARAGKFDFIQVEILARQIAKVLAGSTVGELDFGSGRRMTFREALNAWLIQNDKDPSMYLPESDVNAASTAHGTWPTLERLSRILENEPGS